MELTTGQMEDQEIIDVALLKAEVAIPACYKVFIDTIDDYNEILIDGEVLIVHIARSEYNEALDKYGLVKDRVKTALINLQ